MSASNLTLPFLTLTATLACSHVASYRDPGIA